MALPLEVTNYIENYKKDIEKQWSYIEKKNWAIEDDTFKRTQLHKRQYLITDRVYSQLEYFAKVSEDYRDRKTVQSFIELMVGFIDTYIERYEQCSTLYDWTTYEDTFNHLSEEEIDRLIGAETEFQSVVLANVNKFRLNIKKLNLDDMTSELYIPIHSDKPIPLIMRKKIEGLFPDVKSYMERRFEQQEEKE